MPTHLKEVSTDNGHQSPKIKVTHAWVDAFNAWNATTDEIGKFLSDEAYIHETLPKSLSRPARNKHEWLQYFKELMTIFKEWRVEILSIVEGPEEVAMHAKSKGLSTTDSPYNNEYMVFLTFDHLDADEPKICHVKEFVDSGFSKEFFMQERERRARLLGENAKKE